MRINQDNISKYIALNYEVDLNELKKDFKVDSKQKFTKMQKILKKLKKNNIVEYKYGKYFIKPENYDIDLENAIKRFDINNEWSKKCKKHAKSLFLNGIEVIKDLNTAYKENRLSKVAKDFKRKDFTSEYTITMDGVTAKDFDDAYSLYKKNDKYYLKVHIADVSHYVVPGSPLDKEAIRRGNSYYLGRWVIPMLPFELSNELCSLKQDEVRFAMSVEMVINDKGVVEDSKFYNSLILVDNRIPYSHGNNILKNKKKPFYDFLNLSYELKNILNKKRMNNNSIDFEFSESKMIFENDPITPSDFIKIDRGECERIVEEFMLLTNQVVAKKLKKHDIAIYRVHDKPKEERRERLEKYLKIFGYNVPKNFNHKEIVSLLNKIKGKSEEKLLNTLILRTMSQAVYSEDNIGHFGLAFDDYVHFTSPIRRYADLIIHRLLKSIIKKSDFIYNQEDLSRISKLISKTERNAVEAERYVNKLKGAKYINNHLGEKFNSIVSGSTEKGMFFELIETGIEGFLPGFLLEKEGYRYNDEYSCYENIEGDRILFGDKFVIEIFKVNPKKGFVDLKLIKRGHL